MFVSGEDPVRVDAACRGPKAERTRRRVAKVASLWQQPNRRTKQPNDLQANAAPRPFSGGTPLGKPAAFRGTRR